MYQQEELLLKLTSEESERDERWCQDIIRLMVSNLNPLVLQTNYDLGNDVLFGVFPKTNVEKLFKGKIMEAMKAKLSGSTVYFFEKIRNAVIDERINANLSVTLNSLDPEKEVKKKSDRELLINRKGIESLTDEITGNNGMPPVRFKGDDFHGNVDDFDQEGFDEMDNENVKDFFDSRWGLNSELQLQNVVNAIFRLNQVTRKYDKYINDILICLRVCSQVYVDEVEGKIKIEYLCPTDVDVLGITDENDQKGAQGFRVRKTTNIRGLIRRFGDSFSFNDNWQDLLRTVNFGRADQYTGIYENDMLIVGSGDTKNCITLQQFLDFSVTYSYVEFRVINGNTKYKGGDKFGNLISVSKANHIDGLTKETKYKEDTYRAYFLDIGEPLPKIIKWGKLFLQPTEGVYDEYSGFSILVNGRKGIPMVDILKPFYHMMQVSFTMFEMLVNDVKPDGYIYNYDAIVKVAQHLQEAKDTPDDIRDAIGNLMAQFQESPNMLTVTPTDDTDNIIGGDAFGVKEKKNGLNKAAEDLMKIMDWCEMKATDYLGTQGIELAEAKDGFKLSLENRRRTRAATAFIDFILLNHIEDQATAVLSYAQDISKYKDIAPYKYLENLVGPIVIEFLNKIKKSPHRYATFLDTFNNDIQLLELRQMAQSDHQNGRISLEQYALVVSFENIKQAIFYLSQERKKADKKRQKDSQNAFQAGQAEKEAQLEREMKLENLKGEWRAKSEEFRSNGFIQAAQINVQGQIAAKQMQEDGQNKRLADNANNEVAKIAENADRKAQEPVPLS